MIEKASIVIASRNEGKMLKQTVESIRCAQTRIPYEVIVVDDGSDDGSFDWIGEEDDDVRQTYTSGMGLVPARSKGVELATGDMLVFCDAHIEVESFWLDEFVRVMGEFHADAVTPVFRDMIQDNPHHRHTHLMDAVRSEVWDRAKCGRTFRQLGETAWMSVLESPFETPVLPGACFAVRAEAFQKVGGYEKAFRGYGGEEEEMSLKLWLNGYTLYATPHTCIRHQFRRLPPYRIETSDFLHNKLYTALCHYNDVRAGKLFRELAHHPLAQMAYDEVFTPENVEQVRIPRFAGRKYDDDWFFEHFNLAL